MPRFPKSFLRTFSALIGMLCAASICLATTVSGKPPNILFIVADDLGYEMLGSYGSKVADTPHLDQLALKGTRFTRAYTSPVCTPSRMSIYTGTYTPRHGFSRVIPVHEGKRDAVNFQQWTTYAQLLREAGYITAVTGKWQMGALEFYPEHCRQGGFDSWCVWQIWKDGAKTTRYWNPALNRDGVLLESARQRFGPDVLTDYVIATMRDATERGQPFCIQHNMMLPHVPIVETPAEKSSGEEASLLRMITYMDSEIGRLLDSLDELGIRDNTVVIFAGDNGTQSDEARQLPEGMVNGGKWNLNDAGLHVPLIVAQPGTIPEGRSVPDMIDFADFFPTLCELAGVAVPGDLAIDGISFVPSLMGTAPGRRVWVTGGIGDAFCVFDGEWRLAYPSGELVDCRKLPEERLADMGTAEAKEARERLYPILEYLNSLQP